MFGALTAHRLHYAKDVQEILKDAFVALLVFLQMVIPPQSLSTSSASVKVQGWNVCHGHDA